MLCSGVVLNVYNRVLSCITFNLSGVMSGARFGKSVPVMIPLKKSGMISTL